MRQQQHGQIKQAARDYFEQSETDQSRTTLVTLPSQHFDKVVAHLNTIDSQEGSLAFLEDLVKPEFNNWEGKEEYEKRFIALIHRRFS